MSMYSDYKCGALTKEEFDSLGAYYNRMEKYYEDHPYDDEDTTESENQEESEEIYDNMDGKMNLLYIWKDKDSGREWSKIYLYIDIESIEIVNDTLYISHPGATAKYELPLKGNRIITDKRKIREYIDDDSHDRHLGATSWLQDMEEMG